ncbi:Unknown protein, partial [Striga hermonthica]
MGPATVQAGGGSGGVAVLCSSILVSISPVYSLRLRRYSPSSTTLVIFFSCGQISASKLSRSEPRRIHIRKC